VICDNQRKKSSESGHIRTDNSDLQPFDTIAVSVVESFVGLEHWSLRQSEVGQRPSTQCHKSAPHQPGESLRKPIAVNEKPGLGELFVWCLRVSNSG